MKKIITIIAISVAIFSCKKEITTPNSGTYRGVFEMAGLNGSGYETGLCTIAMSEESRSFVLSVDTAATAPYFCAGNYKITSGTTMTFSSEHLAPINGDQNIILDSIYNYTFDNLSFTLTKVVNTIQYDYRFVRY